MQAVQFMALAGSEAQPIHNRLADSSTDGNRGEEFGFLFEEIVTEGQKPPESALDSLIDGSLISDQPKPLDDQPVDVSVEESAVKPVENAATDTPDRPGVKPFNGDLPADHLALVGAIQVESSRIDGNYGTKDFAYLKSHLKAGAENWQSSLVERIADSAVATTSNRSTPRLAKVAEAPQSPRSQAISGTQDIAAGQPGEFTKVTNRPPAAESVEKSTATNMASPGNGVQSQGLGAGYDGRLHGSPKSDHTASVRYLSTSETNSSSTARLPFPAASRSSGNSGGGAFMAFRNGASEPGRDKLTLAVDEESLERSLTSTSETLFSLGSSRSVEGFAVRPEIGRLVAAQMAEATLGKQNKPIEVALSPEELGRVRMVLSISDTGVAVSITAERPETLELMRRHIEQLAEEFRRLGYEDINFNFSGGNGEQEFDRGRSDPSSAITHDPEHQQETPVSNSIQTARESQFRGLDLRL